MAKIQLSHFESWAIWSFHMYGCFSVYFNLIGLIHDSCQLVFSILSHKLSIMYNAGGANTGKIKANYGKLACQNFEMTLFKVQFRIYNKYLSMELNVI